MPGIFTISLDFELHWGGFEKWPLRNARSGSKVAGRSAATYDDYFLKTRKAIPEILSLFAQYEVHATWATVGMLFHHSREALLANAPSLRPSFKVKNLSAYHYIDEVGIGLNESDDPFHFAPTLIQKISATPFQELGTHTFAHYYCNEVGQSVQEFREDLRAAQWAAGGFGAKLRSLVFPRNQFNEAYLRACYEEGISIVRSNPLDWFWRIGSTHRESAWKRINRGLDAYLSVGKKSTYKLEDIEVTEGLPICLPASRLLRPYNPKEFFLNSMKIERIKKEMETSARAGEVYHLWWHPHNFGAYPEESLRGLEKILSHYASCRKTFDMHSMTMGEISDVLKSKV